MTFETDSQKQTLRNLEKMKRIVLIAVVVATVALIGTFGSSYYYSKVNSASPISAIWPAVSWRLRIFFMKAYGGIPELSWV